ncbi:cilia- and flagella-associated protein 157-like [Gigantopelta aegis]|uniref:cilia- and flagella-associated protein 157-like n=1 Tax=Gigantopelta aegis TaxID=1735272 RepID=UPI001B88DB41|nr:cilia- and flagella-associated protein 157-like [Gigantopelta aegis]
MPPKKKKSGKKKGQGKKSGKKSGRGSPSKSSVESLNELSKEFYLVQIRDLENRLVRYQKKCDELTVRNTLFQDKFDQMDSDKRDTISFWKRQVETKSEELADLNDRLIGLQQAKDAEKEEFESQLSALRGEYQEMKDQLTSENMILGGKLASLEEFKVQKEDLMAKFALMEEELKQKDKDHKDSIYSLERKAVIDKDRLKKEMILRVNQVAAEFRKVSNKQMAETTKRTIRENVSINAQLAKMSDKTMELIQENDELRQKEKTQRQHIELLETNEKDLLKKNHSNQKIIKMLTEKCRNQEAMIAEFELRETEYQDLESESEQLRKEMDSIKEENEQSMQLKDSMEEKITRLTQELQDQRREKTKVEQVLADASMAIKLALRKIKPDEEGEDLSDIERHDQMLEHLLILLNSAAAVGVGPCPSELGKQYEERTIRSPSRIPGSGKGLRRSQMTLSPISRSGGTLPHYNLGDLGLIPRPKRFPPTNTEKMNALSVTTRLGALRKVLTRSIGIQTVSVPKAMFYSDQLLRKVSDSTQAVTIQEIHSISKPRLPTPITPLVTSKTIANKVF